MKSILKYFLLVNIIIDALSYWFPAGGLLAYARFIFIYGVFFYLLFANKIEFNGNKHILVFSIYSILQIFFAQDFFYSTRVTLQIIAPLLSFYIGYAGTKYYFSYHEYFKQVIGIYFVIVTYALAAMLFNIGISDYTDTAAFTVGGFRDSYNSWTYSLLMFPFLINLNLSKKKKLIAYILFFVLFILLLISMKRIAIVGLFFGMFIYFILTPNKTRFARYAVIFSIMGLVSYSFYGNLLEGRYRYRQDQGRLEQGFLETELRYLETTHMIKEIYSFKEPTTTLFGLKAFDSRGAFGLGGFRKRQLHVDYNLIAYSAGLVGLLFYLLIHVAILKKYLLFRRVIKNIQEFKELQSMLIAIPVLLLTSLFTSFGGQMYSISFRTIVFMTIGVVLSHVRKAIRTQENVH